MPNKGLQQLHSFHMFSVWSLLGRTWSGLVGWRILVKRPLTPRCYSPLQSEGQPQQAVAGQRVECVYGANQLLMIFGILWLFRVVLNLFLLILTPIGENVEIVYSEDL